MSRFGPPFRRKKSEKPGPKNQKSGHGPLFPDHVRTFCLLRNLRSGGRYSGRQNVQVWSTLPQKKVRKTWTEKSKVRTRSTFSGPCPDFLFSPQRSRLGPGWVQVGSRCEHPKRMNRDAQRGCGRGCCGGGGTHTTPWMAWLGCGP